jgi:hypothetical protein
MKALQLKTVEKQQNNMGTPGGGVPTFTGWKLIVLIWGLKEIKT